MIYGLFLMAYVAFTSYYINNEISLLPSFEYFFTAILDVRVSHICSMTLLFSSIVLSPLLFGLLLIVAYKNHGFNFKRPPSRRYSVLCTVLFYSILIHITTDTFFFLELLASSKVIYYLFRMSALVNDKSYMMTFVYKSLILLFFNSLSFMVLFFLTETCISIKNNNAAMSLNMFVRKNRVAIGSSGTFTAVYILMINFFSYRYHLTVCKESVVHSETLWPGFVGSVVINTLLMGFYYVLSLDT